MDCNSEAVDDQSQPLICRVRESKDNVKEEGLPAKYTLHIVLKQMHPSLLREVSTAYIKQLMTRLRSAPSAKHFLKGSRC